MLTLLLAVAASVPIGVRAELAPLGRGSEGTVMGVAIQIAPEDRARVGERVRLTVSLVRGETVLDSASSVVSLAPDGSAMTYHEWPKGEAEARVTVESLDGKAAGAWRGTVVVPEMSDAFEPGAGAPPDAAALAVRREPGRGVLFRAPRQTGGLGAVELEVEVPEGTAKVEFSQDGHALFVRNRPPWTVSVPIGEVAKQTTVSAVAYAQDGSVLGEDAFTLNVPSNQLAVKLMVRDSGDGGQLVTVSVSGPKQPSQITLTADDTTIASWERCPCVTRLPRETVAATRVLTAEAETPDGIHGDAVYVEGQGGFVEQVRVDKVELPVVVLNRAGEPVSNLARGAFKVSEDGVPVKVEGFATTADLPLGLGLAVDVSGSMEPRWDEVRQAVKGFVGDLLRTGDENFLVTFSWDTKTLRDWSGDARAIPGSLADVKPEGGTSLYDALVTCLEQFRGRRGRNALVVLTDGDDTTSRTAWGVALRYVKTARVPIFPIGLRVSALDFSLRGKLRALAEATGGEAFFPSNAAELRAAYAKISDQLRSQYILSYVSPSTEGPDHFRAVKVEVDDPALTPRTIAGYFPSR